MQLPKRKRGFDNSAAIAIVGVAMIGIEAWSRMVGLIAGIALVILAGVLLFVPESRPPAQEHKVTGEVIHKAERTLHNPHGKMPGI